MQNSIIHSDCFSVYHTLSHVVEENNQAMYSHYTVNHSENFVDPITRIHTQNIEGFFSQFRKFIDKCSRKRRYLAAYIDEFIYRWNKLEHVENKIYIFYI